MELQISYLNTMLIFVILAMSLNLLLGYAGQVSVAHGAFAAIGGYTTARLLLRYHIGLPWGLVAGFVISALIGLLIGIPALRLSTEYLILLTLAVQTIIIALVSTVDILGGTYGLQSVRGFSLFGHELTQPSDFLPLFVFLALVCLLVLYRLGESAYGRVLRGIREDEVACRSLGKNVFSYKLAVFSLTAGMAGIAGTMLVMQNGIAAPNLFGFDQSTIILAMVILGGSGNLLGSALGAVVLVLLTPLFQSVFTFSADKAALWRLAAYGLVLVLVVLIRPQGILPERFGFRKRKGRITESDLPSELAEKAAAFASAKSPRATDVVATVEPSSPTPDNSHAADAKGEVVLEVKGLCKSFGGIAAAQDLNISLRRGTITAIVGPNGAGKTTVFNLLTGSIRADSGTVTLKGENVSSMRPDQIARAGMTRSYQDVRLFPRLPVLANVMLAIGKQPGESAVDLFFRPRRVRTVERATKERAMHWLSFVGMSEYADLEAGSLAFGQQKLVALARVLATEAEVILLDEPASGIDEQWVDVMLGLIEEVRDQGRTVCIVEHNLNVVGRLADHTYFMELGRITAEGSFQELTTNKRLSEAYFGTA